jgi:prevent-host-death family protein
MKIGDENWEIGDRRGLNVSAYDAYVLACAINQRAPLLTLGSGLRARAGIEIGCTGGESTMKSYSYSEARGNFATVLDEAERDGAVEIRRRDGTVFRILPLRKSKASPLDVKGVKVKVSADDLVAIVREGRERKPYE